MSGQASVGAGLRLVRALGLSGLVVALAAVAHRVGGGMPPSAEAVGALVALSLPVTVLVSRRTVSRPVALVVLGVGQLALHRAFELGSGCAASVPAGVHHAQVSGVVRCGAAHAAGSGVLGAHAMAVWHVVATVLTALAVAALERGAAHVVALLAPVLRGARESVVVVPRAAVPVVGASAVVVEVHPWVVPARRGPPRGFVVPLGTTT